MSTGRETGAERGERIRPTFEAAERRLTVYDPIERRQLSMEFDGSISPRPVASDRFRAPVDAGVVLETTGLQFPNVVNVVIRERSGTVVAQTTFFGDEDLPPGEYSIEIDAVVKLYLQVTGGVRVQSDSERTTVEFDRSAEVLVGARSRHGRPAGTITVDDTPEDALAAVSAFGSALKTTTPERSYPTLRGHLPLIERGNQLSIPSVLDSPDTGITIELPPRYEYIYPAAPLAFYLGAELTAAERPAIVANGGYEPLDEPFQFERSVERTLKRVFLLDCVTRSDGLYPVELYEREILERELTVDFDKLYELSPAERLVEYLELPYETIEPLVPQWRLVTQLEPDSHAIEVLPFAVNDLAVVRTPSRNPAVPVSAQETAVGEFLRGGTNASAGVDSSPHITDDVTVQQIWLDRDGSRNENETTLTAFQNRLDREPSTGPIDITVVCNDPKMRDEERDVVDEVYGTRDHVPYQVAVKRGLTTEGLAETLSSQTDFLHYIGHIDEAGFQCTDGRLDVSSLSSVGVDAFLLNACQSYRQGMELVQRGSIGGVVTHSDIVNRGAVEVGSTMARLLNRGFPLRPALSIARTVSVIGAQYVVVGDGSLSIAQPEGPPNSCLLESTNGRYHLTMDTFPSGDRGFGTIIQPLIEREDRFYLLSSNHIQFDLTAEELETFLSLETVPVRYQGELFWSTELNVDDL